MLPWAKNPPKTQTTPLCHFCDASPGPRGGAVAPQRPGGAGARRGVRASGDPQSGGGDARGG